MRQPLELGIVAAQVLDDVADGRVRRLGQMARAHHPGGGVVLVLEQFGHLVGGLGLHVPDDLLALDLVELGKRVGSFRRVHFFEDVSRAARVQQPQDRCLDGGLDLLERLRRHFLVKRLEQGLALFGAEFFDDIGQVGGMDALQPVVRDQQPQAPLRVRLDNVAGLPWDRVGGQPLLNRADGSVGQDPLGQAPERALHPHADLVDPQLFVAVLRDAQG